MTRAARSLDLPFDGQAWTPEQWQALREMVRRDPNLRRDDRNKYGLDAPNRATTSR